MTFDLHKGSDPSNAVRFIDYVVEDGYVLMENTTAATANRASVRSKDDGDVEFRYGGQQVAFVSASGFRANQRLDLVSSGIGIRAGGGSPEGSVTAPVGTVYLSWSGGRAVSLWIKELGSGNTGWAPVGHTSGPTSVRPASPTTGMHMFDTTIGKPIWWSGTAWVDATGTAA